MKIDLHGSIFEAGPGRVKVIDPARASLGWFDFGDNVGKTESQATSLRPEREGKGRYTVGRNAAVAEELTRGCEFVARRLLSRMRLTGMRRPTRA
jgi:hypothetical protein